MDDSTMKQKQNVVHASVPDVHNVHLFAWGVVHRVLLLCECSVACVRWVHILATWKLLRIQCTSQLEIPTWNSFFRARPTWHSFGKLVVV